MAQLDRSSVGHRPTLRGRLDWRAPEVPSDHLFYLWMNISYLLLKYNLEVDLIGDKLISYFIFLNSYLVIIEE